MQESVQTSNSTVKSISTDAVHSASLLIEAVDRTRFHGRKATIAVLF